MAKKSAISKGYRKQTAKKPYLSKRDIIILCVLVAAVAIGAILLFRYDDGALKVKDGKVVADGENWLIVNGSNARGRARYYKLGEMGEIAGYGREARGSSADANVPEYVFTPEGEGPTITVTCSHVGAEALAKYSTTVLSNVEGTDVGEVQSTEFNGRTVTYFPYTGEYIPESEQEADAEADEAAEAPAEGESEAEGEAAEAATDRFTRSLSGYIDASNDSSVVFHLESKAETLEACLSDEALMSALEQAVGAVTLESAEK